MKLQYRILILVGVFLVSLAIFYHNLDVHTYMTELKTVGAAEATLPVISFMSGGEEINETLGYTFEADAYLLRESITPVSQDLSFSVIITEHESSVKRLRCEVMEIVTGTVLDTKEVKALRKLDDGRLVAPLVLGDNFATDTEYTMRITLTTDAGRDIYFYTRLLVATHGNLEREMAFVRTFHSSILDKTKRHEMERYLETSYTATGEDYSHVTIQDTIETVGYGDMEPTELYCSVPTITEYTSSYVSAKLDYRLELYSNDGLERYSAQERFRFRSSSQQNILYNYDRDMNAEFDGTMVSINRNQIKLGLSTNRELNYMLSDNKKYLLFAYDGDMWQYDMAANAMVQVFTYDKEDGDYARYYNRDHDFRLISVEDNGDADFVFYGYITRGQYEGRVGILYYRYYAEEHRIEEMMFVPVTVSYEVLKEEFGELCYMNDYDEFYFKLYDTLYLYRTLVNDFTVVAEKLSERFVLAQEQGILVYQSEYENADNKEVIFYDLENRSSSTMKAPQGDRILLLGTIDEQMIYGLVHEEDITFYDNGEWNVPMYKIMIEELDGTIVKEYEREGEYFASAEVVENAITIKLHKKTGEVAVPQEDGTEKMRPIYVESGDYNILKSNEIPGEAITIGSRTTDLMHREYYMNLPEGYKLEKIPTSVATQFTVLTNSTAVRVGKWIEERYYAVAYGKILLVSDAIGECIALADDNMGAVYDAKGNVVWVRGIKKSSASLKNLDRTYANDTYSEQQAILQMFLSYKGSRVDAKDCNLHAKALLTWLTESIPGTAVDLTGANLSQVLYFVSEGRPVCSKMNDEWVLITGYEPSKLTIVIPGRGKTATIDIDEAKAALDKRGIYYSYVD